MRDILFFLVTIVTRIANWLASIIAHGSAGVICLACLIGAFYLPYLFYRRSRIARPWKWILVFFLWAFIMGVAVKTEEKFEQGFKVFHDPDPDDDHYFDIW